MNRTAVKILVSACLLGEAVRYDGGHQFCDDPRLRDWQERGWLVPVCPEVLGGLPTPRSPAEIQNGDGSAVLLGIAHVRTQSGLDVTTQFISGATKALECAQAQNVVLAVLASRSPSCGSSVIYSGNFDGVKRPGMGVTTALLRAHGIRVCNQYQLTEARAYLHALQ